MKFGLALSDLIEFELDSESCGPELIVLNYVEGIISIHAGPHLVYYSKKIAVNNTFDNIFFIILKIFFKPS